MEPFFLRCETCHARLRVRDERFLGQVQSCPKCGSMVQIIAPAGWLATGEAAPAPEPMEVAATASPTIAARVLATMQTHALFWAAGAATALVAVGLVGFLALGGSDEVVALPQVSPAAATQVEEPSVETPPARVEAAIVEIEEVPVASVPASSVASKEKAPVKEQATPPAVESSTVATVPIVKPEKTRTLTLDPVPEASHLMSAPKTIAATPVYSTEVETEVAKPDPAPPAAEPPTRITNVKDRLAVPIESIDLPAMPIGEFLQFVSSMAAVRIELDAKVLGEVGLSSHSTVTVRGDHTTVGKLLAGVLKDHQLTCTEREGVLVVVKAKR